MLTKLTPGQRRILTLAAAATVAGKMSTAYGLNIVPNFLPSVTGLGDAAQVESAFNYAAQQYDELYSNNITININVNAGTSGLGGSNTPLNSFSYSTIYNAMNALNSSSDQTTSATYLPSTNPVGGSTWWVSTAEQKALGINNPGGVDGTFTFNANQTYTFDPYNRSVGGAYDFIGVAEHEISEILGRIPGLGGTIGGLSPSYIPYDLFRYTSAGVRNMTAGNNIYFSYDGGTTNLRYYNYPNGNGSDPQDWLSNSPDSYNAFGSTGGQQSLSDVDVNVMHVLGYNAQPTLLTWSAGAVAADFLTSNTWSSASQSNINPHHDAFLWQNTSGSEAYHFLSAGENVLLGSFSDTATYLEVSNGTFLLGYASSPSGPGYGLLVNQDGGLFTNTSGVLDVDVGPLSIGDAAGVTNAYADFYGNSNVNVGYISGAATPGLFVGNQGTGTVYQYDSAGVSTNLLDVGTTSTGNGTYNLQNTASLTVSGNETIGDAGTGTFTQSAGTHSVGGTLVVGNNSTGSGTFNLNGGTLTAGDEIIGNFGYGVFNQNGGAQTISNNLLLGAQSVGSGYLYVNAGTTQVNGSAYVAGNASGIGGIGNLLVDGGSITINGTLKLYNQIFSGATLTSGTLTTGILDTSGASNFDWSWTGGTFHLTGEPLDFIGSFVDPYHANPLGNAPLTLGNTMNLIVNSWEWLSDSGDMITQNAGSTNTCNYLYMGSTGTAANYTLNGGTFTTNFDDYIGYANTFYNVGGAANFVQTGGTHTVPTLYVGYNRTGTYTISGGSLGTTDIDVSSFGTFHQSGGAFNFSNSFNQSGGVVQLDLGLDLFTAHYNMSGGSLTTQFIHDNGNPSLFNWTAGSVTITNQPVDISNGADPDYNGIIFGNSLTLNSGMSLTVANTSWWEYLYGNGSSITQNAGSSNTTPYFYMGNTSGGGSPDTYALNGGTFNVTYNEYIGFSGSYPGSPATGTFNHSGGTNSASYMYLGYNGPGTYNLSGGALNVANAEYIGNSSTGAMNQSGGSNTAGALVLNLLGSINMSAGTLSAGSTNNGGNIVQTGGSSTLGPVTGSGNLSVGNGGSLATMVATGLQQNIVKIFSNGLLQINGGTANTVNELDIIGTGRLDLTNHHLFINYGVGPDPILSVAALLASGYAGGAWNGTGIMTSAPLVVGGLSYGIGYADSADPGNPAGLSSGTIEVKYTLLGDADLSGIVNGIDFGILAANFNKGVTGWDKGDFDYNNIVNGIDFGFLAANFNKGASGAAVGPPAWADPALMAFAQANGLLADVPEPASAAILLTMAGLLTRRSRTKPH